MVKKICSIVFGCLLLFVICMTYYKLNKRHDDRLYDVLYSKIEYASKRCYLEKKCDKSFKLEDLYNNNYLNVEYDPISKEELNKELKITVKKDKVIIDKSKG